MLQPVDAARSLAPCLFALVAALGPRAAAQEGPEVVGILRTQDLQPARNATIWFAPAPLARLEALGAWQARPAAVEGSADARGEFRLPCPDAPGLLVASTASGLAALAAPVHPGDPVRLELVPCADLRAPEGEPTTFWLSVRGSDRTEWSTRARANVLRLAAVEQEVWTLLDGIAQWQRIRPLPGETLQLQAQEPRRRILGDGTHQVVAADWPEVELLGTGGGTITLCGPAAEAPLAQVWPDGSIVPLGTAPEGTPPRVRPHRVEVVSAEGTPLRGATVWLTTQRADASHLVAARVQTDERGLATVPVQDQLVDTWLVVEAEGLAPRAQPLPASATRSQLHMSAPVPRTIRVLRPDGSPAPGVDLRMLDASLASASAVLLRTDAKGMARAPLAYPEAVVAAVDPRYACEGLAIGPQVLQPELRLTTGVRLRGRAVVADDQPAAGAVVTLRDPGARLLPRERSTRADAQGWFEFPGLPEGRQFVVFAQQQRGGRTWSGKLVRALADEGTWTLELRDEDPAPPGQAK